MGVCCAPAERQPPSSAPDLDGRLFIDTLKKKKAVQKKFVHSEPRPERKSNYEVKLEVEDDKQTQQQEEYQDAAPSDHVRD
jgi:hypothetical protein